MGLKQEYLEICKKSFKRLEDFQHHILRWVSQKETEYVLIKKTAPIEPKSTISTRFKPKPVFKSRVQSTPTKSKFKHQKTKLPKKAIPLDNSLSFEQLIKRMEKNETNIQKHNK